MLIQSGSVFQILLGRDTGWQPQRRDDGSIPFKDIVRRHRSHTVLGALAGISAFMIATSLFLWMSPTIIGLLLAIPLSWLSGQLGAGLALKRLGLLTTPEEYRPPDIATRANELQARNAGFGFDDADGLRGDLCRSDSTGAPRRDASAGRAAQARRDRDRAGPGRGQDSSTPRPSRMRWNGCITKERMVVLHDRALLDMLVNLKPKPVEAQAAE